MKWWFVLLGQAFYQELLYQYIMFRHKTDVIRFIFKKNLHDLSIVSHIWNNCCSKHALHFKIEGVRMQDYIM